jgi:YD repeat-containing protein
MPIRHILAAILAGLILVAAPLSVLAASSNELQPQDAKLYDASGRYQGRVTSSGQGQTKAYDKSGHYQGKTVRQGKSIKVYDKSGRYQGRITVR